MPADLQGGLHGHRDRAQTERQSILRYGDLRDQCVYPDVKVMLNEMVIRKEKMIRFLENIKAELAEKFHVMDQIRDGFEM